MNDNLSQRIPVGQSLSNHLETAYAPNTKTLLFDVSDGKSTVCQNLDVEQAKAIRKILNEFIEITKVETITVKGKPEFIKYLREHPEFEVVE